MPAKGDPGRAAPKTSRRLKALKGRIEQASALIEKLRESNYSLESEVTELKRQVASHSSGVAVAVPSEDTAELQGELAALHEERKKIRTKVEQLLDRIGKLEASP